jgi:hypothetical protein
MSIQHLRSWGGRSASLEGEAQRGEGLFSQNF